MITYLVYNSFLDSGDEETCCNKFELNSTGPSARIVGKRFGDYSLNDIIDDINDHSVYDLKDGGARIMFHKTWGWRVLYNYLIT